MANTWLQNILAYENSGAKRNLPVDSNLEKAIADSVLAVYGDGYKASIISGGQGEGSRGTTGSRRHTTKGAADVYVYDPAGNKLSPDELVPLGQHWAGSRMGGVGFPANGQSMHLDLIGGQGPGAIPLQAGEGMIWYYGTPTAAQRKALTSGELPKYRVDPQSVAKGLVPPGAIPEVVASELDTEAPAAPLALEMRKIVAPTPRHISIGERARAEARAKQAPTPMPAESGIKAREAAQKTSPSNQARAQELARQTMSMFDSMPGSDKPSGKKSLSQPTSPAQGTSFAGQERGPKPLPGGSSNQNISDQRSEQQATRQATPKPAVKELPAPPTPQANRPKPVAPKPAPTIQRQPAKIPDLTRIAETLPNGSNPRVTGFSYANDKGNPAPAIKATKPIETAAQRVIPVDKVAVEARVKREEAIQQTAPKPAAAKTPADRRRLGQQAQARSVMDGLGFGFLTEKDPLGLQSIADSVGAMFKGSGGDSRVSGSGSSRERISAAQIERANSNSSNHNSAALAAINRGEKSYTSSDGSMQPTVAMNGNVRNTYGD